MTLSLTILQIVIATLLVIAVLLQMRGSGLSGTFGGGGEFYSSRRSAERVLVIATVVLSTIFAIVSILLLLPR